MNHSFSVEIAAKYGLHEAIMLENLYFWTKKNIANGTHYHDGLYWTYNSAKAMEQLFPYMSNATIRRVLAKLEENGLIKTGNYNRLAYDRTKWYGLTEKAYALFGEALPGAPDDKMSKSIRGFEQMELSKTANGIVENSKPIPDINTDNKPDNKDTITGTEPKKEAAPRQPKKIEYTEAFEEFWRAYPQKEDKAPAFIQYKARLKSGYTEAELLQAAKGYAEQCRRERTENRYIKRGKTFLGPSLPFVDFIDAGGLELASKPPETKSALDLEAERAAEEQFAQLLEYAG